MAFGSMGSGGMGPQGLAFLQQVNRMQNPGGSPTEGLIAQLMRDNPGGLLGALTGGGGAGSGVGVGATGPVMPGAEPALGAGGQGPAGLMSILRPGGAAPGVGPTGPVMPPAAAAAAAPAAGGGSGNPMEMFMKLMKPMGLLNMLGGAGGISSILGGGALGALGGKGGGPGPSPTALTGLW